MSLHPRVVVCLDVKDGRVVKGTRFEGLRDVGDPVELAARYEAEGADENVTAIGAKLAAPERMVIACEGDGAYMFGVPVAAQYMAMDQDAPFLTVIYNNQIHNAPRVSLLGGYPEGVSERSNNFVGMEIFPSPDYAKLGESCGAYGEKVEEPGEVIPAPKRAYEAMNKGNPALLDVRIARPTQA